MSTPFQNRLIGSIIVAAAAVIFLPDILDGEKQKYQADFETIPQAPQVIDKSTPPDFPSEKLNVLETKAGSKQANIKEKIHEAAQQIDEQLSPAIDNETVKVTPIQKESDPGATTASNTNKAATSSGETEQWVIQLGSYQHEKNVQDLVAKLKANGYPVFVKPIKTKNGVLTKVFVGPELIKSVLEKQLSKIEQLTNAQGKISQYN